MARRQRGRRNAPRRTRRSFRPAYLLAIAAVVAVAVAGALVWFTLFRTSRDSGPPRAAIVDQLAFNLPNQNFVTKATGLLQEAGYKVDYFPADNVTVDFFRDLPSKHYDFILFRAHADRLKATAKDGTKFDDVVLFTTEPYDKQKYVSDQAANRLVIAKYHSDGEAYFGVAPDFFRNTGGNFHGATLVVMGCEGFLTERTAQTFVNDMGAKAYISWNESVSAGHTDKATEVLLRHLLIEKNTASQAVLLTMADVGPDPVYKSRLLAYPPGS
jgi:hypothetical protein